MSLVKNFVFYFFFFLGNFVKKFKLVEIQVCGLVADYIILIAISMAGVFILTGLKMLKPNQAKNKVKTRKDNANDALDKVNDETIVRLTDQLRKEAGRANKLQALKDKNEGLESDLEESGHKQVTFEEIEALVKTSYPKYSVMVSLMKNQIMDMAKGKSLEEVIELVKQITGNKQSQGISPQASATWDPNWA